MTSANPSRTPAPVLKRAPAEGGGRPVLFWVLLGGALSVVVLGGVTLARARVGGGGGDVEERLARIEERLAALGRRAGGPTFIVDPSAPADKASLAEAVAALSRELADVRSRLGGGDGEPSASPHEQAASEDAGDRRRSIRRLRELAKTDPEARRLLSKLLADADPRVRREALEALGRLGDPAAIGEVSALLADEDPNMRARAARVIGEIAERAKDPADRVKAAQALEGLLGDERPGVRKEAVEALREMGGKETAPALMRALADKNFEVQEEAVEGLARAGDPAAVAALRQTYGDGAGPNALEAALALKKLGDPGAFQKEAERLRTVLAQPGSPDERREALQILAEHSPGEAQALLQKALRDPSEAVRREAQRLIDRGSPR